MSSSSSLPRAVGFALAVFAALAGGLGAGEAGARATLFELRGGAANPWNGVDVGALASPAAGDFDGDGDLDWVVGKQDSTLAYYANTGGPVAPVLVERTGAANPFAAASFVAGGVHPAVGDVDADGDLDLILGLEAASSLFLLENTGTATNPVFGSAELLAGLTSSAAPTPAGTPALVDLDADGDLDLGVGRSEGDLRYFENTGSASAFVFVLRSGAANPLAGVALGARSTAAFGDLDRDGDPDLVASSSAGALVAYRNTGSAIAPAFVLVSGLASPFAGVAAGTVSRPALADLDADGDLDCVAGQVDGTLVRLDDVSGRLLARTGAASPFSALAPGSDGAPAFADLDGDGDRDLLVGAGNGALRFFANDGTPTSPVYVERTGSANPLAGQNVGSAATPAFGDLDADGDLDLVVGENDGVFNYYANTGTPSAAVFVARTGAANPCNGLNVGNLSAPALGDLDHDGDLDLVAGELDGILDYYENVGTNAVPAFVARVGIDDPFDGIDVGQRSTPALGDPDGDGDLDLGIGTSLGTFVYFENVSLGSAPLFTARSGVANPLNGEDVGSNATPAWVDADGDGDEDLVAGEASPVLDFYESTILDASLGALELFFDANPLDGFDIGGTHSSPALVDLDHDGDSDVVAGESDGVFHYYENVGSARRAVFVERFGAAHPLDGRDVGGVSAPVFGDLDRDGDPDLLVGQLDGRVAYFENAGSAEAPSFVARIGSASPTRDVAVSLLATPALGDVDGDGDLDLLVGQVDGLFDSYVNTGSARTPVFVRQTGAASPFSTLIVELWATPGFADVDADGDLDLFSGNQQGQFSYFENTGTARTPVFVRRVGAANPLDGEDVGERATATFADLDGNGQLDLVTGNHAATFQTYVLPEPGMGPALAAGLALLGAGVLSRGRSATARRGPPSRRGAP